MLRHGVSTLALLLALSLPAAARAQGVVPGGWAPQFGYEVVVGPGAVAYGAGASYGFGGPSAMFGYGYGYPGFYGASPYGMAAAYPMYSGAMGFNGFGNGIANTPPVDQATNALNPLIHSVRHATRTRRAR